MSPEAWRKGEAAVATVKPWLLRRRENADTGATCSRECDADMKPTVRSWRRTTAGIACRQGISDGTVKATT